MALHEHEPCSLEGDPLRDGTVTPETPIKDTPPVVVLPPPASDGSSVPVRGRRRGTHDITAASPRLSPEHPITVTPPTPGMPARYKMLPGFRKPATHNTPIMVSISFSVCAIQNL